MGGLLSAAALSQPIIIEHGGGGTPWWVPLAIGLGAAVLAYLATWRFKRVDFDRENALRAADLVDEAEQIASRTDRYGAEGGARTISGLLRQARIRAEPLHDSDLDDRLMAAHYFAGDLIEMRGNRVPERTGWRKRRRPFARRSFPISPLPSSPRDAPDRPSDGFQPRRSCSQ